MTRLFAFWLSHRAELASLFGQHVLLVAGSTLVAVALGVPLGIFSARRPRLASPLMAIASPANKVRMLRMPGNCVATSSVEKPATCTLVMSENP